VPDAQTIRAILDLGVPGLLVVGILGFATGFIVTGKDRDEWKTLAKSMAASFDRLADVLEDRRRPK
jgi:hypothetical protein